MKPMKKVCAPKRDTRKRVSVVQDCSVSTDPVVLGIAADYQERALLISTEQ